MATIGTTEIGILDGSLPSEWMPIAASQSGSDRIRPGYLVKLASGRITNGVQASASWDTDTPMYGFADFESVKTVNGVSTALAAGVLVKVIPFCAGMFVDLPTVGATPDNTSDVCSGANTAGWVVTADANRKLQVDLSNSTKATVRPYALNLLDWRDGYSQSVKGSTGAVGDRYRCAILNAGKQVIL